MRWIEIPAQRVLEIGETELLDHFDAYNEDGADGWTLFYEFGQYRMNKVYRFRRRSNGEMFKHADVITYQNRVGCYYLQPL
jgi:hypothetical protein